MALVKNESPIMNTLLILEANSISYQVARQLVSELEGYENRFLQEQQNTPITLTLAILHKNNEHLANKIANIFNEYLHISSIMQNFGYCGVTIKNIKIISVDNYDFPEQNQTIQLLLNENDNLKQSYSYNSSLLPLTSDHYERIITFVSVISNESDNLPLAVTTLSLFKDSEVYVICQCNGEISNRIKKLSSITSKHLALTGYVENAHLYKGFTTLQSACTLFKALTDSLTLPFIANSHKKVDTLHYKTENLFYGPCSLAIFRVAIIALFTEGLENKNLQKLQKRIGLTDAFWNSSNIKQAFKKIVANYNNWCADAKGYDSCISEGIEEKIFKRLNNITKLDSTTSTHEKIYGLIHHLHQCEEFLALQKDLPGLPINLLEKDEIDISRNELSPTSFYEFCSSAFSQKYAHDKMRIRTAILDCWEEYYRKYPHNTLEKQSIKSLEMFFSLSNVGKKILEEGCAYSGMLPQGIHWITSPCTGFAVFVDDLYTETKELKDRAEDFRKFMLCYISLFGNRFSKNFRNYITTNAKGVMDMSLLNSSSLFEMFNQFKNCKLDISK